MAWLMREKIKKKLRRKNTALNKDTVFDFDVKSTLASHLGSGVIMSFLRQLSERLLRVLA